MDHMTAAIIYDFDGTLVRGNLQEQSFIPKIGMERDDFWKDVKLKTRESDADEILMYMQYMIEKAKERNVEITKEELRQHGESAQLFDGLLDGEWFKRINAHGAGIGINVKHYIVSSGIKEMILGCPISDQFSHIFASQFHYENNIAVWPAAAINYTTKTQYLFRINKGIMNNWDNDKINQFTPEADRPIPFGQMIFIGDGDTDIPTMKMITYKGGQSIAVYDPNRKEKDLSKIHRLISDGRVEFIAPADYRQDSQIEIFIKGILGRMKRRRSE